MGWNSWNIFGADIDDKKIRRMADRMVELGLVNYGYAYINIDDGWQGVRGGKYNAIMPNDKFPDMKGLVDYVHSKGLKIGIYSSPWVQTFAGTLAAVLIHVMVKLSIQAADMENFHLLKMT